LHLIHIVSNLTLVRRRNAMALFQEFAGSAITEGVAPKGLEQAFAARAQISPSMWSQIKSSRPIGDKLARQLEHHGGKPAGWLDEDHGEPAAPDAAEEHFVALARTVWRASTARQKRVLSRLLKQAARSEPD
jgi:hypothetical protein